MKLLNNFWCNCRNTIFRQIFVEKNGLHSWISFFISFFAIYIFRDLLFYSSTYANLYPMYSKIVCIQVCVFKLARDFTFISLIHKFSQF